MGRPSNHDHVARTLRALAILRGEPGWHHLTRLAELVDAKPVRLRDDLRRCCYAADDWHLPLFFGSDVDHPDGDTVVSLSADTPVSLPLPSSRVELIRLSLLADAAARRDPDHPRSAVLAGLHRRLSVLLDSDDLDNVAPEPASGAAIRSAIAQHRNISYLYRSLTDDEPGERTVTPLSVHRRGRWWLLDAIPIEPTTGPHEAHSYRLDRIIGDVTDTGPTAAPAATTTGGTTGPGGDEPTTAIRLRLHDNDLWVVDDLSPTDLEHHPGDLTHVTIHLYPPVGERLSRVVFLADPATTRLLTGHEFLDAHRRSLRRQAEHIRLPAPPSG